MTLSRTCAVLLALAGCRGDDSAKPAPEPKPAAAEAPEPPANTEPTRDEVHAFCVETLNTAAGCVADDAFWDVLSTMYIARYFPDGDVAPDARAMWVSKMRDYLAGIKQTGQVADNCDATLEHNRWPTRAQIDRVRAAATSCTDFANAYGFMLFGEGAFHDPR